MPVYVLEFLIGKYAATDDPAAIAAGLEVVNQTLRENFIRPDEAELTKARVKQRGQVRLIDKVDVRLVASEDKFWAHLQNFNDKYVHIGEDLVYRYDRLLQGGAWSQLDLIYDAEDDEDKKRPFYIKSLKPIQVAAFDRDAYLDGRRQFSRDSWLDLVMRTIGLEPNEYSNRGKLLALTRLIPMAERNYNLIELGPWGTGKSFVYRESNPNAILISGGKVTVAQLFINMSSGRVGLLGTWDVVTFDEVAGLQMSDTSVVNMLKDYMESGSFARGKEEVPAEASVVLIGNTSKPHTDLVRTAHLFADLPPAMIDPAFLDRIHFYLPGWETPKLESRLFTNHFGFVSDYFAEALRQLRKDSFVRAIDEEFALGASLSARDEKSVRKTVSGLLKILHPHGEWTRAELREYLEFALEGRRRVKEQLKKLAAHDYAKTAFSYIERDTGHEYWVDVPEQPDKTEDALDAVPQAKAVADVESVQRESVSVLIEQGEGRHIEFKQTGRLNSHTGQRDPVLEQMVVKAVAGFLNSAGGTLLVGVKDDGEITGIEADLPTLGRKANLDGYALWLSNLLDNKMGPAAVANAGVFFESFGAATVCRVDVKASSAPVFVKGVKGEAELFVRLNNATRGLNVAEALDYVRTHWG
ncbi:ATP-dependent Lon protease [Mycolicibacterium lutetiense]|uniref:ATP-dependent Lon protease n=1 Tax=Mycolicibacterium lutetiense TaxID=1641992 RepID=A0ABS4ZX92_9MYCO|nr:ATP-dependent Lon protease [Mycolicibacterium lutetiense]